MTYCKKQLALHCSKALFVLALFQGCSGGGKPLSAHIETTGSGLTSANSSPNPVAVASQLPVAPCSNSPLQISFHEVSRSAADAAGNVSINWTVGAIGCTGLFKMIAPVGTAPLFSSSFQFSRVYAPQNNSIETITVAAVDPQGNEVARLSQASVPFNVSSTPPPPAPTCAFTRNGAIDSIGKPLSVTMNVVGSMTSATINSNPVAVGVPVNILAGSDGSYSATGFVSGPGGSNICSITVQIPKCSLNGVLLNSALEQITLLASGAQATSALIDNQAVTLSNNVASLQKNNMGAGNYVAQASVRDAAGDMGFCSLNYTFPQSTAPVVDLKVNATDGTVAVAYNGQASLTWTSSGATACSLSPSLGNIGTSSTTALPTGNLTSTTTFTLTCTGPGGSASDSVTVTVPTVVTWSVTFNRKVSTADAGTDCAYIVVFGQKQYLGCNKGGNATNTISIPVLPTGCNTFGLQLYAGTNTTTPRRDTARGGAEMNYMSFKKNSAGNVLDAIINDNNDTTNSNDFGDFYDAHYSLSFKDSNGNAVSRYTIENSGLPCN